MEERHLEEELKEREIVNLTNKVSLKPSDKIEYQMPDSEDWFKAVVKSRAGKTTGKYSNWFNIEDAETNEDRSIDLTWKLSKGEVPLESVEIVTAEETLRAKETELEKLREFDTYEEVEDCGQDTLSTSWVITEKNCQVKARLLVRGFEEEYELQRDSPADGKRALKVFLSVASSKTCVVKNNRHKISILTWKALDRDIYLKPPKESGTSEYMLWKLKHCLYGLKDGAGQFYLSVKEELLKLGFRQSDLDSAVFTLQTNGVLRGMICCHVDYFLHAGDEHFEKAMEKLRNRFSAGKVEEKNFSYIGFSMMQGNKGITLDQSKFMEKVDFIANRADPEQIL